MAVTAIHPGEHLAEELNALDMSAAELARQRDVPTNRITQILNGTRTIMGDTALRLAHFFGTSAELWLNLQSLSELRLAQEKHPLDPALELSAHVLMREGQSGRPNERYSKPRSSISRGDSRLRPSTTS